VVKVTFDTAGKTSVKRRVKKRRDREDKDVSGAVLQREIQTTTRSTGVLGRPSACARQQTVLSATRLGRTSVSQSRVSRSGESSPGGERLASASVLWCKWPVVPRRRWQYLEAPPLPAAQRLSPRPSARLGLRSMPRTVRFMPDLTRALQQSGA